MSTELVAYEAACFKSLIGVLQCIVKLGRADLEMETLAMASMFSLPRKGHIKVLFQMFAFLKNKYNYVMVFDQTEHNIDKSHFNHQYWSEIFYVECKE